MTEQKVQNKAVKWMKKYLVEAEQDGLSEIINLYGIGEVSTTRLAEACAYDSGIFSNADAALDDDTHIIWDAAIIAAEWFESQ